MKLEVFAIAFCLYGLIKVSKSELEGWKKWGIAAVLLAVITNLWIVWYGYRVANFVQSFEVVITLFPIILYFGYDYLN